MNKDVFPKMDGSDNESVNELQRRIEKVIFNYKQKQNISIAEILGTLEVVKQNEIRKYWKIRFWQN